MADNDQSAVVQELLRRRDSLDPDKQAVVDELAKRMNLKAEPEGSAVSRYASNATEQANPVSLLRGMGESLLHPINAAKAYLAQNTELANRAEAAYKKGDYGQAATHLGNLALQAIPGLGATNEAAGEQIARGDIAGGLGKSSGAALGVIEMNALPIAARGLARGIEATPRTAAKIGTKIADAATKPGVIKALEHSANYTIGGSAMHLNVPGMAAGVAGRVAAGMLEDYAARKAAGPVLDQIERAKQNVANQEAPVPKTPRDAAYYGVQAPAAVTPAAPVEAAAPAPSPVSPAPFPAESVSTPPAPAATMEAMPETPATAKVKAPRAKRAKATVLREEAPESPSSGVAQAMHNTGITYKNALKMEAADWAQVEQATGASLTPQYKTQVLYELKKLGETKPAEAVPDALKNNPKALKAAQAVAGIFK